MLRSVCRVVEKKGLDLIHIYRVLSFIVCLSVAAVLCYAGGGKLTV
jgi:hypothetical protein